MSSTYKRDFPEFKAQLAARQVVRRLAMARLAEAFRESLTDAECAGVVKALGSGDARTIADLTISQRNALMCLLAANEAEILIDYLRGRQ